jgi:uncharacterized membrane protein YgdD (TMEM256/DUF423 family)
MLPRTPGRLGRLAATIGAGSALLAVAAGAFAAHVLRERLEPAALSAFNTAAEYQMYHALALFALGLFMRTRRPAAYHAVAVWCFVVGMLLFSGSLYALALSGVRSLGIITPFGGTLFLCGWAALAIGSWRDDD